MAFGKDALVAENAGLKVEVSMLRDQLVEKKEEIVALRASLARCQDALIAKEAPEAYRDHQFAKHAAEDNEPLTDKEYQELERNKELARLNQQLLVETESPLFRDAEDMVSMLSQTQGAPTMASLHDDGES